MFFLVLFSKIALAKEVSAIFVNFKSICENFIIPYEYCTYMYTNHPLPPTHPKKMKRKTLQEALSDGVNALHAYRCLYLHLAAQFF